MISVDFPHHRFHLRAAAVIVDDDFVLLHRMEGDTVWALPGDRVNPGESGQDALVREFAEELSVAVEPSSLLYVVENFFTAGDKAHHEIGLYFQASFHPGASILDKSRSHAGIESNVSLEFRWFHKTALTEVDLRPAALLQALSLPTHSFAHIVQNDCPHPANN